MSEFKRLKPSEEVRKLKEWGPGRVSQLRLFVSHLEQAFGSSLAAQVTQSSKRKFSEFVPKVVSQNITTEVEFRELRISFEIPRGLRNFLFYELQLSLQENLNQFEVFISNDPQFVFPNLLDGTTYYFRVRVVTKDGLFGPWSDTLNITTPFSQAYGLKDGTEITSLVFGNNFLPVFNRQYTAIGGDAYYSVEYECEAQVFNRPTANLEWSDCELRWLLNNKQVGQNFLVTTYRTNAVTKRGSDMEAITADIGSFDTDSLVIPGIFSFERKGSFTQKFTALSTDDNPHTIALEARILPSTVHPTPNDFLFYSHLTQPGYSRGMVFKFKNFNIFEALTT
jgi:hypothetical protein